MSGEGEVSPLTVKVRRYQKKFSKQNECLFDEIFKKINVNAKIPEDKI